MSLERFERYAAAIRELPLDVASYTKEQLMAPAFLMEREGKTEMYYAPHNEIPGSGSAQITVIGITPGWTQMERAYRVAREGLAEGRAPEDICRLAKRAARFAGSMRRNLVAMLDGLGLPEFLSLTTAGQLFEEGEERLHTTSALPFPVFVGGRNYTGHAPELLRSPFLREFALRSLRGELAAGIGESLIIPLGRTVESSLRVLAEEGALDGKRVLWGFPHPSGANGHRYRQLEEGRAGMGAALRRHFALRCGKC